MRTRRAARVIILDPDGRVLVVRGHDADDPDRHWWFTIGGGIDPGEGPQEAACREVREETGLHIGPGDLEGPVLTRSAIFDFAREHCRQDEVFYCVRLAARVEPSTAGWTEIESSFIDEIAWLTAAQLRSCGEEVFPHNLADLVEWLSPGWDGRVREIGLQQD